VRFDDDLFLFCGVSVTTEVDSLLCFIKMEKNAFTSKITRVLSFFFFLVVVFWLLFAFELFSLSSHSLSSLFSYTQKQQYAYYNVF
jgi:hypothetical protein